MSIDRTIQTVKHYGHYSVVGPVKLPLALVDGRVAEFIHDGFKFPSGRYSVIYQGTIRDSDKLLVRITSNCQWAFYFDSQYCDCRWQNEEAKRRINEEGRGLIIFAHDQNGKGVPLEDHWLIYAEGQKRGLELVVDAYEQLGFREDYRDYRDIIKVLQHYGIKSVRLLTNSPRKKKAFDGSGIKVTVENFEQPINPHLKQEYRSKKHKLGHWLKVPDLDLE